MTIKKLKSIDIINVLSDLVSDKLKSTVKLPVSMVNIIKQEIVIEESLKKKLELICEFSNTTLKIINGSIRKIDRTNLTYVEPHRIIINDITFLLNTHNQQVTI